VVEADLQLGRGEFRLESRFQLAAGWTVLFGPSGAGKTTLLRILSGLLTPDRGRITLRNRVLTDTAARVNVPPGRRRIGFVTQQPALFPHLTGRANVAFGLYGLTREASEQRVAEVLDLFEAGEFAERRPAALSGGEQHRIALARALAPQPELLLLDEPFAALDSATKRAIIEKLHASGVPVLYVSHALADAWQMNANVVILEAGQITSTGPARQVLAPYRDRLLQQLGAEALSDARLRA